MKNKYYTVFVGGVEVNDTLLNYQDAIEVYLFYKEQKYEDVRIQVVAD